MRELISGVKWWIAGQIIQAACIACFTQKGEMQSPIWGVYLDVAVWHHLNWRHIRRLVQKTEAHMNAELIPTVLVVEDHPMFVRALLELLSFHYPLVRVVVAPTCSAAQAWLMERQAGLDLRAVLCDLTLPDAQGAQVVQSIRSLVDVPIVVISAEHSESVVNTIESLGIAKFVSKRSSVEGLLGGIASLLGPPQPSAPTIQDRWALSSSQRRVAQQLINGLANKEIAKALQLSPDTVKTHVSEIMSRLGARNRTEAVLKLTGRTQ